MSDDDSEMTDEEKMRGNWPPILGADPTPWSEIGETRAVYLRALFEDALEPEVRELGDFVDGLTISILQAVTLRDRLDEMVKAVRETKGRVKGRGLKKRRERWLAEREAKLKRWLDTKDFEVLAAEEIASGNWSSKADAKPAATSPTSKVNEISELYRKSMRPFLPKNSTKPAPKTD